jgi:hypothetical protein
MIVARIFTVILVLTLSVSGRAHAECLSYNGTIRVQGTLTQQTFPGPPNYESIETGDQAETYWLVVLDGSACVAADPADDTGLSPAVATLERIQLVVTLDQCRDYADRIGHHVSVSGQLFGAHTGHHRTPVLLNDVRFDP